MEGGGQRPVGPGGGEDLDILLIEGEGVLSDGEVAHPDGLGVDGHVELGGLVGAGQSLDISSLNLEGDGLLLGGSLDDGGGGGLTLQPLLVGLVISGGEEMG